MNENRAEEQMEGRVGWAWLAAAAVTAARVMVGALGGRVTAYSDMHIHAVLLVERRLGGGGRIAGDSMAVSRQMV